MIRFDDDQSVLLCRDADTKTAPWQDGRRFRRRDLFAARHDMKKQNSPAVPRLSKWVSRFLKPRWQNRARHCDTSFGTGALAFVARLFPFDRVPPATCPRGFQVTRLTTIVTITALAAGLAGCASSPLRPAQIVQTAPPGGAPARPPSAPQDPAQCIHDEGYGRWTDCGSEM
jgi:hypothetical protein